LIPLLKFDSWVLTARAPEAVELKYQRSTIKVRMQIKKPIAPVTRPVFNEFAPKPNQIEKAIANKTINPKKTQPPIVILKPP
jgi:hypothetical protein